MLAAIKSSFCLLSDIKKSSIYKLKEIEASNNKYTKYCYDNIKSFINLLPNNITVSENGLCQLIIIDSNDDGLKYMKVIKSYIKINIMLVEYGFDPMLNVEDFQSFKDYSYFNIPFSEKKNATHIIKEKKYLNLNTNII